MVAGLEEGRNGELLFNGYRGGFLVCLFVLFYFFLDTEF